ncbi:MAG: hypothetical protein ABEI97_02520 [Candidatus Nanohaloarchaea archaeon]
MEKLKGPHYKDKLSEWRSEKDKSLEEPGNQLLGVRVTEKLNDQLDALTDLPECGHDTRAELVRDLVLEKRAELEEELLPDDMTAADLVQGVEVDGRD